MIDPFWRFQKEDMLLFHQSDLSALARCPAQLGYKRAGLPTKSNSAMAFGSVIHDVLEYMERHFYELRIEHAHKLKTVAYAQGYNQIVFNAKQRFVHYWNPMNIEAICDPVPPDGWLPRQGYNELRTRGIDAIQKYGELIRFDDSELLATEYSFRVPIVGTVDEDTGEPHELAGSVDRLAVRHYLQKPVVAIDDWKSGRDYKNLRHNLQFTAYSYASTQKEFWTGAVGGEDGYGVERGTQLYERFADTPRRNTWINLRLFKFQDAGWRGPQDYERFKLAILQFAALIKADIFPLTISGEVCQYCEFRSICGGIGVPDDNYGKPGTKL